MNEFTDYLCTVLTLNHTNSFIVFRTYAPLQTLGSCSRVRLHSKVTWKLCWKLLAPTGQLNLIFVPWEYRLPEADNPLLSFYLSHLASIVRRISFVLYFMFCSSSLLPLSLSSA